MKKLLIKYAVIVFGLLLSNIGSGYPTEYKLQSKDPYEIKMTVIEHDTMRDDMFFYAVDFRDLEPYYDKKKGFEIRIVDKMLIVSLKDFNFEDPPPLTPISRIFEGSPLKDALVRKRGSNLEFALEFEKEPSVGLVAAGSMLFVTYLRESENFNNPISADIGYPLDGAGNDTVKKLTLSLSEEAIRSSDRLKRPKRETVVKTEWSELDYDEKATVVSNVVPAIATILINDESMQDTVFKFVKNRLKYIYYGEKGFGIPYGIEMAKAIDEEILGFSSDVQQNMIEHPGLSTGPHLSAGAVVFTGIQRIGNPFKFAWKLVKDTVIVGAMALAGTACGLYKAGESTIEGDFDTACNHLTDLSFNGAVLWVTVDGGSQVARGALPTVKTGWNNFINLGDNFARWTLGNSAPPLLAEAVGPAGLRYVRLTGDALESGARYSGGAAGFNQLEAIFKGSAKMEMSSNSNSGSGRNGKGNGSRNGYTNANLYHDPRSLEKGTLVEITTDHGKTYFGRTMKVFRKPGPKGEALDYIKIRRLARAGHYKNSDIPIDVIATCRPLSPHDEYIFYAYGEPRKFRVDPEYMKFGRGGESPIIILEDIASNEKHMVPLDEVLEYNRVFIQRAENALYGANMFDEKRIVVTELDWSDELVCRAIMEAYNETPIPPSVKYVQKHEGRWIQVDLDAPLE